MLKKTLQHPKANNKLRVEFVEKINRYQSQGRPIIYLDESGFAHDMPRTRGYALRGQSCYGKRNWHAKGRVNVIGALLGKLLITVSLFNCNADSDVFHQWVTHDLLVNVPPASIIVMDNASFQKTIIGAGHQLEYLPPYSPDLNPIEHKWAQAKAIRRKERCDINTLFVKHIKYDKL